MRVAVQLCVGVSVAPQVVAVRRKGHWLVSRRMVSGVVPLLVRMRVCVPLWPEGIWPKLRAPPGGAPPVIESVPAPMP